MNTKLVKSLVFSVIATLAGVGSTAFASDVTGDRLDIGSGNSLYGTGSTIAGGAANSVTNDYTAIGGGSYNTVGGDDSVISGGFANTNISSGNPSFLGGGQNNFIDSGALDVIGGGGWSTVTGYGFSRTICGGYGNYVSGSEGATIVGGESNLIEDSTQGFIGGGGANEINTGQLGTIGGGTFNNVKAPFGTIPGGAEALTDKYGQQAYASGKFSDHGDAQTSVYVLRNSTSDTNQTELFLDGSAEVMGISTNASWTFDILIVGRNTNGDTGNYHIVGGVKNLPGNTPAFVGTPTVTTLGEDISSWDVAVSTAHNYGGAWLSILVTGDNSAIRWTATVRTVEVRY